MSKGLKNYFFLFINIVLSGFCYAKNDPYVTVMNELTNYKVTCSNKIKDYKVDDTIDQLTLCRQKVPLAYERTPKEAQSFLEHLVFQEAAKLAVQKLSCQKERLTQLKDNPKYFKIYRAEAIEAWLKLKKSQLVDNECFKKTLKKQKEDQLTKICQNPETREFLYSSKDIFTLSLPVLQSPDVLNLIEKQRSAIINIKTGKPVTDQDLLNNDLNDLSWVDLGESSIMDQKLKDLMNFEAKPYVEKVSQLSSARSIDQSSNSIYELTQKHKDFLFDEGFLIQALQNLNLLSFDQDEQIKVSPFAGCLLSQYESHGSAELVELVAGLYFIMSKVTSPGKFVSQMNKAGKFLAYGWGANEAYKQIAKKCSTLGLHKPQERGINSAVQVTDYQSSKAIDYRLLQLEFEPKDTPSCLSTVSENIKSRQTSYLRPVLGESVYPHCAAEVISNIFSPVYSISYSTLSE